MAAERICPSCQTKLRMPPTLSGGITCPRCLALIDLPAVETRPCTQCAAGNPMDAPQCGSCGLVFERKEGEPVSDTRTCPMCAEDIPAFSKWCPLCGEPMSAGAGLQARLVVDRVARKDTKKTGWVLLTLAVIGCLGIPQLTMGLLSGSGVAQQEYGPILSLVLMGGVIALVIWGIIMSKKEGNKTAQGIGRVIIWGAAAVGALVVVGIVAMIALFVFLFVVCLTEGGFH